MNLANLRSLLDALANPLVRSAESPAHEYSGTWGTPTEITVYTKRTESTVATAGEETLKHSLAIVDVLKGRGYSAITVYFGREAWLHVNALAPEKLWRKQG